MLSFIEENRPRSSLVIAIGGGGDAAIAGVVARKLSRLGISSWIASIAWERYVIDPTPGPISLDEIQNASWRGELAARVNASSYALRRGRVVVFQAVNLARALNDEVYVVPLEHGVKGYVKAIEEIRGLTGAEAVIGVDVGGDVLAAGHEDELWSPLADYAGLAALSQTDNSYILVASPGSDGELSQDYLLRRIDEIAIRGGLVEVFYFNSRDISLLRRILEFVRTEASLNVLRAYSGERGDIPMRSGSRYTKLTFFSTLNFLFDAKGLAEFVEPAKRIAATASLSEILEILNSMGIYTELNLEMDLSSMGVKPEVINGELLYEVRRRGRERLLGGRPLV